MWCFERRDVISAPPQKNTPTDFGKKEKHKKKIFGLLFS